MKNKSIIQILSIAITVISVALVSCEKKSTNISPLEQDDLAAAAKMDLAFSNMVSYHDSCETAKLHTPKKFHHYDSIFHHHDSLYNHHHKVYHHGDTIHHHSGYHHSNVRHHKHDSIIKIHHKKVH